MKRKIIQIADSTFLVSIPVKWARKHGFKKGDSVEVEEQHNKITITSEKAKEAQRAIINAKNLDERALRWTVSSYHRAGYDELEILYNDKKQLHTIEDLVKNLLLGFVIVSQEHNKVLLKSMALDIETGFDQALRRAFLVTHSLADQLLQNIKDNTQEDLSSLEKTNNQLTNFCMRLINLGIYKQAKSSFLYLLCWNLEKIADEYKYIMQQGKIKTTPELLKLFTQVNELHKKYYNAYYQNATPQTYGDLYKEANKIKTKLIQTKADFETKHRLLNIIERHLNYSSIFIVKEEILK